MLFGIALLVVIYILYVLLVKGLLWKLILAAAGWFGLFIGLRIYLPESKNVCLILSGHSFSWAVVIPTAVILLAMLCTKDE